MCTYVLQVSVDPVISTSSRISEGSTVSSRHSRGVSNHGSMRDDLMTKLKSLEQEHQRLLSSHSQTEVAAIYDSAVCVIHTYHIWYCPGATRFSLCVEGLFPVCLLLVFKLFFKKFKYKGCYICLHSRHAVLVTL